MKASTLGSISLILATVLLTMVAMKLFGSQLGVAVKPGGVAANSILPMAFCLMFLGVWKSRQQRKNEGKEANA
jgi:predicted tellurium resistance membrane protein TerC